jgi:hypothetical protein
MREGKTGIAMNGGGGQRHLRDVELLMPQHAEEGFFDGQV